MATTDHLKTIQPLLKGGLPRPNMFLDIYKNRRSQHKRVRLWLHADLGLCRFEDLFLTNEFGEQLTVDLLRAAYPENLPNINEIKLANQAVKISESPIIYPVQNVELNIEDEPVKPSFTITV